MKRPRCLRRALEAPPASGDEAPVDTEPVGPRPTPANLLSIVVQEAIARAASPRWPMYHVRQVKQLIRTVDPQFDERKDRFASLIEALKHSQREGVLRFERDRQGVIRVWPAGYTQKPAPSADSEHAAHGADAESIDMHQAGADAVVDGEAAVVATSEPAFEQASSDMNIEQVAEEAERIPQVDAEPVGEAAVASQVADVEQSDIPAYLRGIRLRPSDRSTSSTRRTPAEIASMPPGVPPRPLAAAVAARR